jgi:hypothetical protein
MTGIIYIMTSSVTGLIKIGKTGVDNFQERMRSLEANGYYNVSGLKRYFAMKLNNYSQKEGLLHELFSKHRVGESELFALDFELAKELLLTFEGEIFYPKDLNKETKFSEVSKERKQNAMFSFYRKGLKNGDEIVFIKDKSIKAVVCGEREVLYEEQVLKLSPLTYNIFEQKNMLNASGAYQGASYFEYNGKKLTSLPDLDSKPKKQAPK